MDLQEVGGWGMDWIELAQERDRWQALVNVSTNVQVPYNAGNFWLAENLLASQKDCAPWSSKQARLYKHICTNNTLVNG